MSVAPGGFLGDDDDVLHPQETGNWRGHIGNGTKLMRLGSGADHMEEVRLELAGACAVVTHEFWAGGEIMILLVFSVSSSHSSEVWECGKSFSHQWCWAHWHQLVVHVGRGLDWSRRAEGLF
ncbi:hypothetical protein XELAEV_18036411mg [Xenopus laevis]|uniref:Uncharacterized protein n=1 Tax=Xenopus laevis TaxID=8355 RepID=A0A974CHJ8_XENLA|nr:hypothetical protein XELAEV_18036411mg [Xenopus laevis]